MPLLALALVLGRLNALVDDRIDDAGITRLRPFEEQRDRSDLVVDGDRIEQLDLLAPGAELGGLLGRIDERQTLERRPLTIDR